ncbi:MAG: hypothetical protein HYY40_01170 [Bacteroidetes bacterium]|nr:hypothetical protein [Bacteroidota bacterium]
MGIFAPHITIANEKKLCDGKVYVLGFAAQFRKGRTLKYFHKLPLAVIL